MVFPFGLYALRAAAIRYFVTSDSNMVFPPHGLDIFLVQVTSDSNVVFVMAGRYR